MLAQDEPLKTFISLRDEYLDDCLYWEGRRHKGGHCPDCNSPSPTIRCEDCHGGQLLCRNCMVDRHKGLPLHQIKVWCKFSIGINDVANT